MQLGDPDGIFTDAGFFVLQGLPEGRFIHQPQALQCPEGMYPAYRCAMGNCHLLQLSGDFSSFPVQQEPLGMAAPPQVGMGQLFYQRRSVGSSHINLLCRGEGGSRFWYYAVDTAHIGTIVQLS